MIMCLLQKASSCFISRVNGGGDRKDLDWLKNDYVPASKVGG